VVVDCNHGLGGMMHDQIIRNKKRHKIIAIIRAIKFKTLIGSLIWPEGMGSFSTENTYLSIEDILNTSYFCREHFVEGVYLIHPRRCLKRR